MSRTFASCLRSSSSVVKSSRSKTSLTTSSASSPDSTHVLLDRGPIDAAPMILELVADRAHPLHLARPKAKRDRVAQVVSFR